MKKTFRNKYSLKWYLATIFFLPVLGVFSSIKTKSKTLIVFSLTTFFGLVGSLFIYSKGIDGYTHLMHVEQYYLKMSYRDFFSSATDLIFFRPNQYNKDLYLHILSFIAGGILGVPETIHAFAGIILGYFFSKSMLLVFEGWKDIKLNPLVILIMVIFVLERTLTGINSIRMWTALWVLIYASISYYKFKRRKYLWLFALASIIHFSYLLFLIPILASLLFSKFRVFVLGVFLASHFINVSAVQVFDIAGSGGGYSGTLNTNVLTEQRLEEKSNRSAAAAKNKNFYSRWGPELYTYYSVPLLAFLMSIVYIRYKRLKVISFLISSGLLMLSIANISKTAAPAVFGRGTIISGVFLTAALIMLLLDKRFLQFNNPTAKWIKFGSLLFVITAIPNALYNVSYIINVTSIFIFFVPLISWIIGNLDISIADFIRTLLW